jgi:3-oxoacyl-[acyl-carrier-protein] synthase II
MSDREVVLTGFGIVSPIGIGKDACCESLHNQQSGVAPIQAFDGTTSRCAIAAEVTGFEPKQYVRPRKSLKVMSRDIQLGFAAAEMAVADSGLSPESGEPERKGVIFGTDLIYTDTESVSDAYFSCIKNGNFDFSLWGPKAMENMYPLWLLKYLPNMSACHIGIAQDARGANNSITVGDTSSLQALSEAAHAIERDELDIAITGGTSSQMNPTVYDFRGRGRFAQSKGDPASACRPFDRDRDGTVHGEGAAAFILESRSHAENRGANILATVAGTCSRFEPKKEGHSLSGKAIRSSIEGAMREAGVDATQIDHINAHGIALQEEDRIEATAIHSMLGDTPVIAPKSYFGNIGGGSGAVEMAISLLAFQEGKLPVSLNYEHPDPACPVNVVHGDPRKIEKRGAVLLNQGRDGQALAVVLTAE